MQHRSRTEAIAARLGVPIGILGLVLVWNTVRGQPVKAQTPDAPSPEAASAEPALDGAVEAAPPAASAEAVVPADTAGVQGAG